MRRIAEHKRKIWKAMEHTIGMRIPLFLAFLILTLVPLLVQVRFTSGYFYQSHVEERMAEAQNRCLILANKIRSSDYINVLLSGNPNLALDAELSTTADLMNGRIVLVDDSFKILKDTFGLSKGKTLVVEQRRCRIRISVSDRRISPSYQVVFSQGALPRYSKNMKVEMRHVASGPAAVCRAYGVFPAGRTIRANVLEKPYSPSCFPPGKEAERLTGTLRVLADVGG